MFFNLPTFMNWKMHVQCIFNWHKLLAWGSFHMSEYLSSYPDMLVWLLQYIGTYLIAWSILSRYLLRGGICNTGDATEILKEWAGRNKKWAKRGRELKTAWFQLSRFFGFRRRWVGSVSWHRAAAGHITATICCRLLRSRLFSPLMRTPSGAGCSTIPASGF